MKLPAIVWHYLRVKYLQRFSTVEELQTWQQRQLGRFFRQVGSKSPFYAQHCTDFSLADFARLPIIEKQQMMEHFDNLNTVGIRKEAAFQLALQAEESRDFAPTIGSITVGLSSGTSGSRGLFLVSPAERYEWAGTMLAKTLPFGLGRTERIALFLRAGSNLYDTTRSRRIQFEFFDLLTPIENQIERLNFYQPTILAAPPSVLRMLAESRALKIRPETIFSVAEVLDPLDAGFISGFFQRPIGQIYQCTEGFLGVTCPQGTIHLNEDLVFVEKEFLDQEKTRFNPVITDFRRRSQPIIRYRMNDILTIRPEPCPCGSVFQGIEKIEGRCDDVCLFQGKSGGLVKVFPDFLTRAVMAAAAGIQEYTIVQTLAGELEISFRTDSGTPSETEQLITAKIQQLCDKLQANLPCLHFVPHVPHRGAGKLKRVECRIAKKGTPQYLPSRPLLF